MDNLTNLFNNIIINHAAQLGGVVLGIFTFLVAPTAAFYALWIAVLMDLLNRIVAQSIKYNGFWQATKQSRISSKKMFQGTAIKTIAYFFMTVLAYQSKYIVEIEAVPIFFSSMLFLVEVHSIIENLIDAGAEDLKPLLLRFNNEKIKAVRGAGDLVSINNSNKKGENKNAD